MGLFGVFVACVLLLCQIIFAQQYHNEERTESLEHKLEKPLVPFPTLHDTKTVQKADGQQTEQPPATRPLPPSHDAVPQSYNSKGLEFDCSGLDDGNYPDPNGTPPHCSIFYYSCTHHRSVKIDCPHGLYFDPDHNWCESKENVVVCGGQEPTTIKPADVPSVHPTEFDCTDLADGFYPNPKEKCSSKYYACSGGLAQQLMCSSELMFDPEEVVCNSFELTFACTGVRVTTHATEPPKTTAPPNYPIDCRSMEDGVHPDPSNKCSRNFYICHNERTTETTCPGNTFFDVTKMRCDEWVNVFDCTGQPPPTPADVPPTNPPKHVDFDCSNLEDGPYPDSKSKCSNIYYVCFHRIANELNCPMNTYWDPDEHICDGYGNIYACTGKKKVPTTEAPITNMITSPPRIPDYPCSEVADGFYADPKNPCSTTYFVCSKKIDNKLDCPKGLYFDVETEMCDRWMNVFACSGQRPPPTTQPPLKDTVTEKVPFECHGLEDGDYADPTTTCSHIYYTCSGGVARKQECADDKTYFDQEIDLCETFDNVPECSGTSRKLTTTLPPRDVEIHPFDCHQQPNGHYPAGDCEEHYWSCVGGVTLKIDCPLGLKYDVEMAHCDWNEHIPSCGGHRVTYPPQDVTPQPNYPLDCEKLPDGYYPDPDNECSHTFYDCHAGRTTKLDCPAGLFYNPEENRCDVKVHVPRCAGTGVQEKPRDQPADSYHPKGSDKPISSTIIEKPRDESSPSQHVDLGKPFALHSGKPFSLKEYHPSDSS